VLTAAALHRRWRRLPPVSLRGLIGPGPALVLAPHPDDETLGCGGLIARCCAAGCPPVVAILTDGRASHPGSAAFPPGRLADRRRTEVRTALRRLGLRPNRLLWLGEPDSRAPQAGPGFRRMVRRLAGVVRRGGCSAIVSPWRFDPHGDHVAAARIAAAVAARTGVRSRAYPVWGWTLEPGAPVWQHRPAGGRLDVTRMRLRKRAALRAHRSQYGGLITDAPNGFTLPPVLRALVDGAWETYLCP
jgi:LmbE family N-acetylglucosaminyl deacetylase